MSTPTVVYFTETDRRRSEVEETSPGHYRILFGADGEWRQTYQVTNSLERAKKYANEWVANQTLHPLDLGDF